MKTKRVQAILLVHFIFWVALTVYLVKTGSKEPELQNCQTMHDGMIICPPSYPDPGNDQS